MIAIQDVIKLDVNESLIPDRYAILSDSPLQRLKKCIEKFDIKLIKREEFLQNIDIDIQNSDVDRTFIVAWIDREKF